MDVGKSQALYMFRVGKWLQYLTKRRAFETQIGFQSAREIKGQFDELVIRLSWSAGEYDVLSCSTIGLEKKD